jgi:hypothetical protein
MDDGGWPEWRRLVLSEQKRISFDLRELANEVRNLARTTDVDELERRVDKIEARLSAGTEKNEDRKWLIGLAVLVVASILFPSLRVVLFGGGG